MAAANAALRSKLLKNVLLFLPVLAAHQLELATAVQAMLVFIAFCLVASAT